MEAAQTIPQVARRPAAHRSRVTNGAKLLPLTDCRSATARRFRDLYEEIAADLGGLSFISEDALSHALTPITKRLPISAKITGPRSVRFASSENGMTLRRYWSTATCQACVAKSQCTPSKERRSPAGKHERVA